MRKPSFSLSGNRELLGVLVARNIKIRYKNSALGFLWTLLGPIFLIVIYSVFLGLLKVQVPLPVLVIGILGWQFTSMCLTDSLNAVTGHANLIKKTAFPRIILPVSTVLANGFNFLLSCVVLGVYLVYARVSPGPVSALLWLPGALFSHLALCLGAGLLISSANVFFKDTEHILSVAMLAWFFMSPIIYEYTLTFDLLGGHGWLPWIYFANPQAGIYTLYRAALIDSPLPDHRMLLLSLTTSWIVLLLGIRVFQKTQPWFGDEL